MVHAVSTIGVNVYELLMFVMNVARSFHERLPSDEIKELGRVQNGITDS